MTICYTSHHNFLKCPLIFPQVPLVNLMKMIKVFYQGNLVCIESKVWKKVYMRKEKMKEVNTIKGKTSKINLILL